MKYRIKPDTITRGILLILSFINLIFEVTGHSLIPINNEAITTFVSLAWTGVMSAWGYWKNNSFTQAALAGDERMKQMKDIERRNLNAQKGN